MNQHAFLAPSGAGCTVHCPAAPAMQQRYPEDETDASREGVAAHWAAAEIIAGRLVDVGVIAPNGVILTDEIIEGAEMYADDVLSVAPIGAIVERPIYCPDLHAQNWGTPDTRFYDFHHAPLTQSRVTVYLWDFKFGHGIVEVFENWQLLDYASGCLSELAAAGYTDDQKIVFEFRIVQPRAYHMDGPIRKWRVLASDLRGYFNRLRGAFEAATKPQPEARPGAWCKTSYCSAARGCTALQKAAGYVADFAGAAQPHDLPPAALGVELRITEDALSMLTARVDGLREQALAMLQRGDSVPYYVVEFGKGRERWAKPAAEVVALGQMLGVNLAKTPEAITPVQARKAGIPAEVVAAFAETPRGSQKLVRDTGANARKIFGPKA